LALPDVVKRQQRGYLTDEPWLRSGLTLEDVEVLRRRAAQLDAEGYMSMTPYFGSCDLSNLPPQNVPRKIKKAGCWRGRGATWGGNCSEGIWQTP